MPKIISKRCELVKLCHINRNGPVFETQCTSTLSGRQCPCRPVLKKARLMGRIGSGPCLVGQIGLGVRVSASFQKNVRLVGRLGSGPRLVGRIGSGARVSASFQKKCPPRGSIRVRTPPRGRQGRCSVYPRPSKIIQSRPILRHLFFLRYYAA